MARREDGLAVDGPRDISRQLMQPGRRADIDGLRALAILPVVCFHAYANALPGGFTGVDVFFVISGFLIAGILRDESAAASVDAARFYRRRIVRLFPALLAVLAGTLLWGWVMLTPAEYTLAGLHAAAAPAFASNFLLASEAGYFADPLTRPLLHLWSLAVEGQFYIVCTALLLLALRLRAPLSFLLVGACAAASFAYCMALDDKGAAFFSPAARAWEFLAGSFLAVCGTGSVPRPRAHAMSLAGLMLVAAGFGLARAATFPDAMALLPVAGSVLLVAAGKDAVVNRRLLSHPFMVGIGRISYPLYLWHWVTIWALATFDFPPSIGGRAAAVGAALALAWLTYEFVERPARRARLREATRGLLLGGLAVAAAATCVVIAAGVPSRVPGPARPWLAEPTPPRSPLLNCADDGSCASRISRPLIAVWGDSHAAALVPGMDWLAGARGGSVVSFTTFSCPPIAGFSGGANRGCAQSIERTLAQLARIRPDLVVMAARWDAYENVLLAGTIERLGPLATRVVVAGPAPKWQGTLPRTLMRCTPAGIPLARFSSCGARDGPAAADASLEREARSLGVRYWSLYRSLCTGSGCMRYVGTDGALTTYDYGHLSPAAAVFVTRAAQPSLAETLDASR